LRYFGSPSTFGKLSSENVPHDQDSSCMSLLKVTRISVSFGSTPSAPASGTVFTTTGGTVPSVISSARAPIPPNTPTRETRMIVTCFIAASPGRTRMIPARATRFNSLARVIKAAAPVNSLGRFGISPTRSEREPGLQCLDADLSHKLPHINAN
jgi:hypothetical protein